MINQFINEYSPMLTALSLQLCQNQADAADLFQDTWERVVRYAQKQRLDEIENPRAWLASVCTNLYCTHFRRRKRESAHTCSPEDKELLLQSIPDPAEREDYSLLWDVIAKLSPKQKSVIVLKFFYGYSHGEIANMLKIPEGTVRSRLQDALNRLRRDLNETTDHTN